MSTPATFSDVVGCTEDFVKKYKNLCFFFKSKRYFKRKHNKVQKRYSHYITLGRENQENVLFKIHWSDRMIHHTQKLVMIVKHRQEINRKMLTLLKVLMYHIVHLLLLCYFRYSLSMCITCCLTFSWFSSKRLVLPLCSKSTFFVLY